MARSITVSNPHPNCQWTDPNCSICQLHDNNGAHFYFYCDNCIVYAQVDQPLFVEIRDNSNGVLLYSSDFSTTTTIDPNWYYPISFVENGFDGDLRIKTTTNPGGLGSSETTIHHYNCY